MKVIESRYSVALQYNNSGNMTTSIVTIIVLRIVTNLYMYIMLYLTITLLLYLFTGLGQLEK